MGSFKCFFRNIPMSMPAIRFCNLLKLLRPLARMQTPSMRRNRLARPRQLRKLHRADRLQAVFIGNLQPYTGKTIW